MDHYHPPDTLDICGLGPTVVMIHGLGGTHKVWEPQVLALSDRYQTVRFDLQGSGQQPAQGPLSLDLWVEELESLLNALRIESTHFVGHSLGTLVVQTYVARHPQRAASMSLLGVNRAPPPARRAAMLERAEQVRSQGLAGMIDGLLASVPCAATRAGKPMVMAAIRKMMTGQSDEGYAATCAAMATATRPDLSTYQAPLLLIAGEQDTVSPPELSQTMAAEFEQADITVLPDCGHWIPLEQADAVNALLIAFLDRVSRPARVAT